ncbi:MAG TPA: hypothetical protein VIS74_01665 [Chthoniobacterales bacterium]
MRTTLTIDDDLAGILRRRSKELGKPFKEVVNNALRAGIMEKSTVKPNRVRVRPHDFGLTLANLDYDRLNQLVDELEVEDYLRKAAKDDPAGR